MIRGIICAAAAAAFMALAPVPTQAAVANPGLTTAAPAGVVQEARYYRHSYHHHYRSHRYYRHHSYRHHRRYTCWHVRVWRHGHRHSVRRCGWRY